MEESAAYSAAYSAELIPLRRGADEDGGAWAGRVRRGVRRRLRVDQHLCLRLRAARPRAARAPALPPGLLEVIMSVQT